MMNLTPDDPRLSAYVLGELTSEAAAAFELEVTADPAIRLCLNEQEKMISLLDTAFSGSAEKRLLPSQREAVMRAGRAAAEEGKVIDLASARRGLRPWMAGLGAAAMVTFAMLLIKQLGPGGGAGGSAAVAMVSEEVAMLPMPGPSAGGATGSTHVASGGDESPMAVQTRRLKDRPGEYLVEVAKRLDKSALPQAGQLPSTGDLAEFSKSGEIRLPILVGTSSFRWVSGWIREKGELPPKDAVRLEEIINSSAISSQQSEGFALLVESMPCPWDSESLLAGIQIDAGEKAVDELELQLHSNLECRMLGSFARGGGAELPQLLPAGRRTMLLVEFRADSAANGELGELVSTQGGRSQTQVIERPVAEVSDGLRHTVLMAGFGLWLRDEGVSASDLEEMLDRAAAVDGDPVRADARSLVAESLKLVESGR